MYRYKRDCAQDSAPAFSPRTRHLATQVNALVGSQVIAAVKRGEAWACCFWLKCRGGWNEKQGIEHSGPDGERAAYQSDWIRPTEENTVSGLRRGEREKPPEVESGG